MADAALYIANNYERLAADGAEVVGSDIAKGDDLFEADAGSSLTALMPMSVTEDDGVSQIWLAGVVRGPDGPVCALGVEPTIALRLE